MKKLLIVFLISLMILPAPALASGFGDFLGDLGDLVEDIGDLVGDIDDFAGDLSSMFEIDTEDAFEVGETAEDDDVYVTLVDVLQSRGSDYYIPARGNEFIILEFEVENDSDEEVALSTMLCFTTWCDGELCSLSLEALSIAMFSVMPQLDYVLSPGETFKGVIGYEVPSDWKQIVVQFQKDVYFGKELCFIVTR